MQKIVQKLSDIRVIITVFCVIVSYLTNILKIDYLVCLINLIVNLVIIIIIIKSFFIMFYKMVKEHILHGICSKIPLKV